MTAFTYKDATVTFKPANGRNRMILSDLRTMAGYWDMEGDERDEAETALNFLYLVDSVQGDLGFPVPVNGDANPETVTAFIAGIMGAHENLYVRWSNALYETRQATGNDPDLLPASELTDDQKKAQKSKKSDDTKG